MFYNNPRFNTIIALIVSFRKKKVMWVPFQICHVAVSRFAVL